MKPLKSVTVWDVRSGWRAVKGRLVPTTATQVPPRHGSHLWRLPCRRALQMTKNLKNEFVLRFQMLQNYFDFSLGFRIDIKVGLGPRLRMTALQVLSYHDQRHQEDLDHVREKQPENKSRIRIEPQGAGRQGVPAQPDQGPHEDHQEKAHRADPVRDPDRQAFQL